MKGTMELECDVLVVGAGCGGIAAAISAATLGLRVVLTEPSGWLGGQLTAQAVPADEHPWVETTGITQSYRQMREAVRDRYRTDQRLTATAREQPHLNPGNAWVSALAAEAPVIHSVLAETLAPLQANGRLQLIRHCRPIRAEVEHDRVLSVEFEAGGVRTVVHPTLVLEATEEGDLLPLIGCEHVVGAESAAETGEPHAVDGPPDPSDQQAVTWCVALEWRPGEDHTIDRPREYDFWRTYRAPFWPGPQLGWATQEPETGRPLRRPLFGTDREKDLWRFRRIRDGRQYDPALTDVTLVNWPQIDYWRSPVTGVAEDLRRKSLAEAKELTRCFVHWLQTDAPRPDGGTGYPALRPCPEAIGTTDGFAAAAYVRESRRIRAEFTVLEQHVGVQARPRAQGAEAFADSVGIGSYRIDLHPSSAGRGYIDIPSFPFQIPLGALLPVRMDNVIAAGKCLGVTHITNGCYRLHPVEWNVGDSAGALAAYALEHDVPPRAVRARPDLLDGYQGLLGKLGVPLEWPEDIRKQAR